MSAINLPTIRRHNTGVEGRMVTKPPRMKRDNLTPVILGFHGHGVALNMEQVLANYELPRDGFQQAADRGYLAYQGNWGGNLWGNAVADGYINNALTYCQNILKARTDKVFLWAGSMGASFAYNWARANPGRVAAICSTAPAVNLDRLHDNNVNGYCLAEIEAAHGGSNATWDAAKATRDPATYAASLAAMNIPQLIFYSNGDTVVIPSDVTTFAPLAGATATLLAGDPIHASALPIFDSVLDFFDLHPIV